jgi:two-component system response regulator AtoC
MPSGLQAKLLHVLQDKEYSRLGGAEDVEMDARVITATNCNLEEGLRNGKFREDLYYRINVVSISLPPLRERKEDLPELIDFFLNKFSATFNKPSPALTKTTLVSLQNYYWPGNVRELENVIKKIIVLENVTLALSDLYSSNSQPHKVASKVADPGSPPHLSLKNVGKLAAREAERELIMGTLLETHWNRRRAAELLDISYKALLYKIKQNKINKKRGII